MYDFSEALGAEHAQNFYEHFYTVIHFSCSVQQSPLLFIFDSWTSLVFKSTPIYVCMQRRYVRKKKLKIAKNLQFFAYLGSLEMIGISPPTKYVMSLKKKKREEGNNEENMQNKLEKGKWRRQQSLVEEIVGGDFVEILMGDFRRL